MSYQVLARKWRPRNFNQIVGQAHVVKALSNAFAQNRLHHAYLFTGTRGVGKTTIARIIAKCLNCASGITAEPCGQCDACTTIDSGYFIDLIEVDAASRTKVEDTRELLDNVQYAPTQGRFKVYLIDEVHMLSGHSFNALLKTLEEPPPHVKFLLATTDPHKLPVTVLSRCLQFHLKHLTPEQIHDYLATVLKDEKVNFESAGLQQLAVAAKGSMRDALSLLDQAIAYGNGAVQASDVQAMLGNISSQHLVALVEAVINQNANELIDIIQNISNYSSDFSQVLQQLITLLHRIAVAQVLPDSATRLDSAAEITALAQQLSAEQLQLYYQIGLLGQRDLPLAPSLQSGFEMVMLRMLAFQPVNSTVAVTPKPAATPKPAQPKSPPLKQPVQHPPPAPNTPATDRIDWAMALPQLQLSPATRALADHCVLASMTDNALELSLDPKQAPMLNVKHEQRLTQALSDFYHRPIHVKLRLGQSGLDTPAKQQQQQQAQRLADAEQAIETNPNVQTIMDTFNATIIPKSVKPHEE